MKWHKVKVGDFLIRVKDLVSIIDTEEYNLVTIKLYHKGVKLRKKVKGSEMQADKMSRVKAGQFILSGIDARNGAFGIIPNELDGAVVTNDFWHFEIDTSIISNEYFLWLTSTPYFDDICNKASDGTTNRIRLQSNRFFSQELMIPDILDQHKVVAQLKSINNKIKTLEYEYQFQFSQIESLNQAILQEALQGKLVPQNPKDEPASELLKRIKVEKEKSGKKEKALPSIEPEEIPFEIPKSWMWCRLGDMCSKIGSGSTPKGSNYSPIGFPFFRSQNIYDEGLVYDDIKFVSEEVQKQMNGTVVLPNDILLNITGGSLGRCSLVPPSFKEGNVSQHVAIIRPLQMNSRFFHKLVQSPYFQKFIFSSTTGAGREGLPKYNLEKFLVPIPPLSEQKRIVEEIEKQFEKTKQLKEHIIANKQATEQLLKALLHQAFEVKEEYKIPEGKVIEFKSKDSEEYKVTLLAAEIVWQLHKQPTLGHLKLQKIIYLCEKMGEMRLPVNFLRQAMGPYDPKLMRSIDKQLKENKWFEYQQSESLKYKPLEKAGQHKADFEKYFSVEKKDIQYLIDKFIKAKSETIEIVATLYACLDHILNSKEIYSEALLMKRFYEWSDQKAKFEEKEVKGLFTKMIELGVVPAKFKVLV